MNTNRIIYLSELTSQVNCYITNTESCIFYFNDSLEVTKFLDQLVEEQIYVVTFLLTYELDGSHLSNSKEKDIICNSENIPYIILSEGILVASNSDPKLISNFILSKLSLATSMYNLNEDEDFEYFRVCVK